ncbi:MAG: type II toxin-antitoxin system VapC family toxin [Gammaproteobacteria bacterium]|nr:type II toxin-antitoxin system VapC family toxin [Gammaproteobacteria bacterium]
MIHLDTNLLIRTTQADKRVVRACEVWLAAGEALAASSVSWFEFTCGPLTVEDVRLVERIVSGRIVPFTMPQAERAAALFNAAGRKRPSRWDCMIAAAAMADGARLATLNPRDFGRFADAGLQLATI